MRYLWLSAALFAACLLARGLGGLLRRLLRVPHRTFPLLLAGFEAGMMGYALFTSIYGAEALYRFALLDLGQALFVYLVVIPGLVRGDTAKGSPLEALRGFATNPVIVAIAAGLFVEATGLARALHAAPLAQSVEEGLRLVASLTGPLVALVVGYEVRLDLGHLGRPALTVFVRLALWIPLALFLGRVVIRRWLGLDAGFEVALLTLIALPPPFVIPIFMRDRDEGDLGYTLNTIALATLVALGGVSLVTVFHPR